MQGFAKLAWFLSFIFILRQCVITNMLITVSVLSCYGSIITLIYFNILFYRLQMSDKEMNKKSASVKIQIDPIVPITPKVHGNTNQETRKAAVQLNTVEYDKNVMSESPTRYPISCQILKWTWKILKWIWKVLEWIGNLIYLVGYFMVFLYCIIFYLSGICFSFYCFWYAWVSPHIKDMYQLVFVYILLIILLALCVSVLVVFEWRKFFQELKNYLALLKC